MSLRPQRWMDADYLVTSYLDWLVSRSDRKEDVSRWCRENRAMLFDEGELPHSYLEAIRLRRPQPQAPEWFAFPQITLSAAFHLVRGTTNADYATGALIDAVDFAHRLVTRDLLLAIVLERDERRRVVAPLDPLRATAAIESEYRRYLRSTFAPRTEWVRDEFAHALDHALDLAKGPYLQASPPFVAGASIRGLMDEGLLAGRMAELPVEALPIERSLYQHQRPRSARRSTRRNLVIATGLGPARPNAS